MLQVYFIVSIHTNWEGPVISTDINSIDLDTA